MYRKLTLLLLLELSSMAIVAQPTHRYFVARPPQPAAYDTNVVYISTIPGFKPDFIRTSNISVAVNGGIITATCHDHPFTQADSGKFVSIRRARSYPAYRAAPVTLDAKITQVNSSGVATLIQYSAHGYAIVVNNSQGYYGTDNYQALQAGIDSCYARGKNKLVLNYTATALNMACYNYTAPLGSAYARMLNIYNSISIVGWSKRETIIKFGGEHLEALRYDTTKYAGGFVIGNNCIAQFKKFSMICADTITTQNDRQLALAFDLGFGRIGQKLLVDSMYITGEEREVEDYQAWGNITYQNNPQPATAGDTCLQEFKNSGLKAQFLLSMNKVKPDIKNRLIRCRNLKIQSTGRITTRYDQGQLTAGSDTVLVNNPWFSWYDGTDYEYNGAKWPADGILSTPPDICFAMFETGGNYGYIPYSLIQNRQYMKLYKIIDGQTAIIRSPTHYPYYSPNFGYCDSVTYNNGNTWEAKCEIITGYPWCQNPSYNFKCYDSTATYHTPTWGGSGLRLYTYRNKPDRYATGHFIYAGKVGIDLENIDAMLMRNLIRTSSESINPDGSPATRIIERYVNIDCKGPRNFKVAGQLQYFLQEYGSGQPEYSDTPPNYGYPGGQCAIE